MKYIKVLKFNEYSVFEVIEEYEKTIKCKLNNCENGYIVISKNNVVKQADTIEELIQDNDIIYIHDLYPDVVLVVEGNIKPFGYNNVIKVKEWLEYKFTEFDLYIQQPNGDYHKVAEKKQCGELVLI